MPIQQIDQLTTAQIQELHELYKREWWTNTRTMAETELILRHTDEIIAFCESDTGELVAFARVLTDYVIKAVLMDVIVREDYRGTGLGRRLLDAVIQHPRLKLVKSIDLFCLPEMVPFYGQWGFSTDIGGARIMRRRPD